MEFSKIIVLWCLILGTVSILSSYILAYCGRNINQAVTLAIIGTLMGTILAYAIKSLAEKISRNKYNIDKDGNKKC